MSFKTRNFIPKITALSLILAVAIFTAACNPAPDYTLTYAYEPPAYTDVSADSSEGSPGTASSTAPYTAAPDNYQEPPGSASSTHAAVAPSPSNAAGTAAQTVSVQEIVEFLADPAMRGRLVGSPENEIATEYIRDLFESIGLTPFFGDSFLHPFQQELFDTALSAPRLTAYLSDGTYRELQLGSEFRFSVEQGPVDERIAYIPRFGLDSSDWFLALQDIPFVFAPLSHLLGENARAMFGDGLLPPGGWNLIGIDYQVYSELLSAGIDEFHIVSGNSRRVDYVYNIIGVLEGRDSSRAILISAHFDGTGAVGDIQTDGAIDNASGVAAMIYMAAILAERRDELEVDIVFAAYDGEETGLIGSFEFAPHMRSRYEQFYNINIDCVGVYDCEGIRMCMESPVNSSLRAALHGLFERQPSRLLRPSQRPERPLPIYFD